MRGINEIEKELKKISAAVSWAAMVITSALLVVVFSNEQLNLWLVTLPKIWLAVFYLGATYFFMWLFVFVWYIFHHLFHLLVPSLIDWWRRRRAGYLCLIV